MFLLHILFLCFWYSNYMYVNLLKIVSQSSHVLLCYYYYYFFLPFFFFLFLFHSVKFLLTCHQTYSSLATSSVQLSPVEESSVSVAVLLISSILFWSLECSSLSLHCLSALYFSMSALNIFIILILNSHSVSCNISVIWIRFWHLPLLLRLCFLTF